ncbi:MAG: hypothetical protein KF829_09640 [Ferruginibacter sp.]|nr:hypothetical protein [Ferruginibacter sp.]
MKTISFIFIFLISATLTSYAQSDPKKNVTIKNENNNTKRTTTSTPVFQPYHLKARQVFWNIKEPAKISKQSPNDINSNSNEPFADEIKNYLINQNLNINNKSTINKDGTGNWGNQNNSTYGNCLDILTGTIIGLEEAENNPKTVDLIFIAANGSFQIWSPDYARNEVAAEYTSRSVHESTSKWSDVNETLISETKLTSGQFEKIKTNAQMLSAVKSSNNYASSLTLFGNLEGKVFSVKVEHDNRSVYGLIRVVKHYGNEGSKGYLKIQIKSQGIINPATGEINVNSYIRQQL